MPTAKSLERDIKNFTRDKDSLKIKKDNLEKDLRDMLAEEEIKVTTPKVLLQAGSIG